MYKVELSASLESELEEDEDVDALALMQIDDTKALKEAFAKRGAELREALRRGRQWFGAIDTLPERLATIIAEEAPSVWAHIPSEPVESKPVRVVEAFPEPERTSCEEQDMPVPVQEMAETTAAPVPVVPVEVVPAQQGDGMHAPACNGNGRKPPLVFGFADHILLVRQRRSRPQTASPRPKNRTNVQSIPGINEVSEHLDATPTGVMMLSLWDLTDPLHEDAAAIAVPVPTTPSQSTLWAE